jgi:hypothetical protein
MAASCLCFFFATKRLIGATGPGDAWLALRSVTAERLILPLLAFLATRALIFALAGIEGGSGYARDYLQQVVLLSIAKPFVFIIAHVVYFGPAVILLVLFWNRVSAVVRQHGIGMVLFFLMSLFLGLNSESRQLILAYPFFVAFLVKAVEPVRWRASFYWIFGAVALVMSKFWLRINTGPLEGLSPQEFPLQYYFLNHGPWMADSTFFLQAALVSLITLLFAMSLYWSGSWRYGVATPSLRHND